MGLRRYILDQFHRALDKGYIQAYYQPVIRTMSGKLSGFEALARWIDPDRGVIRPDQFIPVLEEAELIHLLDQHIIEQVCLQMRRSINDSQIPVPVSINLSRLDFTLCDIYSFVLDMVNTYHIPRDYICIEITESLMARETGLMRRVIDRFRSAGFQVWMDDFGSGYSSLNTLKDYEFDEIKLDMQFLSAFDQRSRRILASVISMAKEINIHTLAEGVENQEQERFLRNIGCEKLQGYYFGKPLPYDESMARFKEKGILPELPGERKYYDDIGSVNLLSAVPFSTREERDKLVKGRELNSIPLAIAEAYPDYFTVLFYNSAFKETVLKVERDYSDIFSQDKLRKPQPYSFLPANVLSLMDSTRSGGMGRMQFIYNEEYYSIQAKCIAQRKDVYSVLFRMDNLSRDYDVNKTSRLDAGLRQIYTLFERITLIDIAGDVITPLYVSFREDLVSGRTGLRDLVREYADQSVYAEDREAYIKFFNLDTLPERFAMEGRNHISDYFRTYTRHGQYAWKRYTLMLYTPGIYVELIRNADKEVRRFLQGKGREEDMTDAAKMTSAFPEDLLWKNLISSGIANLFWKDADRRFVGVSKGFLDYYGFNSEKYVRGKTDEDLGWHVHPDAYMNDELEVIHEGVTTRSVPGNCISRGENRNIFASKTPIFDESGEIKGLMGFFVDKDTLISNDLRGQDTKKRDMLTGLLNARGILEEAQVFEDEYYLRNIDFVRLHVSIDDFVAINRQYGYDIADKALVTLGRALEKAFGTNSAIGRYSGHNFVILHQITEPEEPQNLKHMIREIASRTQQIDGLPFTYYVSIGYTVYSEFEDLHEQRKKADIRLLADHNEYTSAESRLSRASELFHVVDDIPISYAVYKIIEDVHGRTDAILFYVNHFFEEDYSAGAAEILGHRARELFPEFSDAWYENAKKAALYGETVRDMVYDGHRDRTYEITMNQVIHPGYCCVISKVVE